MKKVIIKYIINVLVFVLLNYMYGERIFSSRPSILLAAFVLIILNLLLKPVLHILALPLTIMTLGIFSWIVNAFIIKIMDWIMDSIHFQNFWQCILAAALITGGNYLIKESKH